MNMVFFNGPITACGMLVRLDFGPAVVLYKTPCAVCVRGLQAGERTLWCLWILTTITMWLCACVFLLMNDRDYDRDRGHIKSSKCKDLPNHFTNLKNIYIFWILPLYPSFIVKRNNFSTSPPGYQKLGETVARLSIW